MSLHFRNLSDFGDLQCMVQLAKQEWGNTMHVIDLPYRLSSWAVDDPDNIAMWWDDTGKLIAWAVMQIPFWSVDCVVSRAGNPENYQIVLDWVDHRAVHLVKSGKGLPCWFINAFSGQMAEIEWIKANGFSCQADVGEDSWSKVWMHRTAEEPVHRYDARSGFRVRPLAGPEEAQSYVDLHQKVFQSRNMQLAWRQRMLEHPDYRNDFDIVVESPDGELVAFCIGWMQKGLDGILRGQIEPLGCHADYRYLGLGRVALTHVIVRLHEAGAQEIWVETDRHRNTAFSLYQHVGFSVIQDVLVFRKDYE